MDEFRDFLMERDVVALGVAFVIGAAIKDLISSMVDNIIMPIAEPVMQGGAWQTAKFQVGPFVLGWGAFLADLIDFIILAFVVFLVLKKLVAEQLLRKRKRKK